MTHWKDGEEKISIINLMAIKKIQLSTYNDQKLLVITRLATKKFQSPQDLQLESIFNHQS
jgi:hypothetical protein